MKRLLTYPFGAPLGRIADALALAVARAFIPDRKASHCDLGVVKVVLER